MNQMDLYSILKRSETDAAEPETFPVRSGRVGPIRFGSTEASFALTRDILIDLSTLSDDAAETPS